MQGKKLKLIMALSEVIKEIRGNKSISKLSNEIDLCKSVWSDLEHSKRDVYFSTLWKISEALDIKLSVLIAKLEDKIGTDFSFIED